MSACHLLPCCRDAPSDMKARKIHPFTDSREVEIASRCCRVWLDEDTLDEDAVSLAERIVRAGAALLPHEVYMSILWSSFLIDVQGSYQQGYAELQNAKKLPNHSMLERFCIFIRDQEHTQKSSAVTTGDNSNVDLVSYVEFQRNFKWVGQGQAGSRRACRAYTFESNASLRQLFDLPCI